MLFRRTPPGTVTATGPWVPTHDPQGRYSTGTPPLDALLGGGFPKGSTVALDLSARVRTEQTDLVRLPLIANFLALGRGLLAVLSREETPASFRERALRYVPPGKFDARVRIPDYDSRVAREPFLLPMVHSDREEAQRALLTAERAIRGGNAQTTYLDLTTFDTLEVLQGPDLAAKSFFFGAQRNRDMGGLGLVILQPGLVARERVLNVSTHHLRMDVSNGAVTLEGVRSAFPRRSIAWIPGTEPARASLGPDL